MHLVVTGRSGIAIVIATALTCPLVTTSFGISTPRFSCPSHLSSSPFSCQPRPITQRTIGPRFWMVKEDSNNNNDNTKDDSLFVTSSSSSSSPAPEYGISYIGGDPCGSKYNDDPFDVQVQKPGMPADMKARIQALVDRKVAEEKQAQLQKKKLIMGQDGSTENDQ